MSTAVSNNPQPHNKPAVKNDPVGFYPSPIAGKFEGTFFNDERNARILQSALIGIRVRHGTLIDSIQCVYRLNGETFDGPHNGGSGGVEAFFELEEGEYITKIKGRAGFKLDEIQFETSRGRKTPAYGGGGGDPFGGKSYAVDHIYPKSGLQYFSGTYDDVITSIQAHWAIEVPPR